MEYDQHAMEGDDLAATISRLRVLGRAVRKQLRADGHTKAKANEEQWQR